MILKSLCMILNILTVKGGGGLHTLHRVHDLNCDLLYYGHMVLRALLNTESKNE